MQEGRHGKAAHPERKNYKNSLNPRRLAAHLFALATRFCLCVIQHFGLNGCLRSRAAAMGRSLLHNARRLSAHNARREGRREGEVWNRQARAAAFPAFRRERMWPCGERLGTSLFTASVPRLRERTRPQAVRAVSRNTLLRRTLSEIRLAAS